jgi:PAS domain-containing protein
VDERTTFYRSILDAVPAPVLVVEDDVRLVDYNVAAEALLTPERSLVLQQRGGEALHCIHATDSPLGCGRGPNCGDCVLRRSVTQALEGRTVSRERTRAVLLRQGVSVEIELLVTAAPMTFDGRRLALLILEDVSELDALRRIVPICAHCRKIRDDREYWSSVEHYAAEHLGVDFSHGLCPACAREHYPDLLHEDAAE